MAINATTPQYRPFEDNDMPGKIVLKQYPFENKIQQKMNNEYKLYHSDFRYHKLRFNF